jgi:hypothetical protein
VALSVPDTGKAISFFLTYIVMIKKKSHQVQPIEEEDFLIDNKYFNERHSKKVKQSLTFQGRTRIEREFSMFNDFDVIDTDYTKRDEGVVKRYIIHFDHI